MRRYNREKQLILESLKNRNDLPTAEDLFMKLRKEIPGLLLSSVQRDLNELCEEGEVIKVKSRTGGPERYDGNALPRINVECEKCGEIFDIFLYDVQIKRLDKEIKKLADEINASVSGSIISITGICKKCNGG